MLPHSLVVGNAHVIINQSPTRAFHALIESISVASYETKSMGRRRGTRSRPTCAPRTLLAAGSPGRHVAVITPPLQPNRSLVVARSRRLLLQKLLFAIGLPYSILRLRCATQLPRGWVWTICLAESCRRPSNRPWGRGLLEMTRRRIWHCPNPTHQQQPLNAYVSFALTDCTTHLKHSQAPHTGRQRRRGRF